MCLCFITIQVKYADIPMNKMISLCQIHGTRKLIWCEGNYLDMRLRIVTLSSHFILSEHVMCSFCMIQVCEILRNILL